MLGGVTVGLALDSTMILQSRSGLRVSAGFIHKKRNNMQGLSGLVWVCERMCVRLAALDK